MLFGALSKHCTSKYHCQIVAMVLGVDPCSFLAVDFDSPQIKVVVQHNMCILHCLQPANTSAYSHWLPQALYSSLYYKHAVALPDWQNAYIEVYACLLLPISKGSIMDNGSNMSNTINTPNIHNTRACNRFDFSQSDYHPSMVAV